MAFPNPTLEELSCCLSKLTKLVHQIDARVAALEGAAVLEDAPPPESPENEEDTVLA